MMMELFLHGENTQRQATQRTRFEEEWTNTRKEHMAPAPGHTGELFDSDNDRNPLNLTGMVENRQHRRNIRRSPTPHTRPRSIRSMARLNHMCRKNRARNTEKKLNQREKTPGRILGQRQQNHAQSDLERRKTGMLH